MPIKSHLLPSFGCYYYIGAVDMLATAQLDRPSVYKVADYCELLSAIIILTVLPAMNFSRDYFDI